MLLLVGLLLGVSIAVCTVKDQHRIHVVSASMAPTIEADTTMWMDVGARGRKDVAPGDIVVFSDPGGWTEVAGTRHPGVPELMVKRVVAIGGQTLSCCDAAHRLVRDGSPLVESYLPDDVVPSTLAFEVTVPPGHLWVMGDNRAHSLDSRQHHLGGGTGFVPLASVRGIVHR